MAHFVDEREGHLLLVMPMYLGVDYYWPNRGHASAAQYVIWPSIGHILKDYIYRCQCVTLFGRNALSADYLRPDGLKIFLRCH